jgi:hypothetical protein
VIHSFKDSSKNVFLAQTTLPKNLTKLDEFVDFELVEASSKAFDERVGDIELTFGVEYKQLSKSVEVTRTN